MKTFKIHSTKFSKNYALSYNLSTDKYLDLELKSAMHVVWSFSLVWSHFSVQVMKTCRKGYSLGYAAALNPLPRDKWRPNYLYSKKSFPGSTGKCLRKGEFEGDKQEFHPGKHPCPEPGTQRSLTCWRLYKEQSQNVQNTGLSRWQKKMIIVFGS